VFYVGRSDSDVRQCLHEWVGTTRFAYSHAPSAAAAFEKECRNSDDFGGRGELDNEAAASKDAA
jgi:hypothetical protein